MKLTFLTASDTALTKRFTQGQSGALIKHPYPMVSRFTSFPVEVRSIEKMGEQIKLMGKRHACLLKGNLSRDIVDERRAGLTNPDAPTEWICLDFDGLEASSIADVLKHFPEQLQSSSRIIQYSASHGLKKGISAHLFYMLEDPALPADLKTWLKHLNLSIPLLRDQISLSRTGMALRWPLDITTCQNDKLLYIAPPIFDSGLKDPVKRRVQIIKGRKRRTLQMDFSGFDAAAVSAEANDLLHELREKAGFRRRKLATTTFQGVEVMKGSLDEATVTSVKQERGFVYLNLNSGDSWGYYHPIGNPEVLYNFKGEPNYRIRDLLPNYYATATQLAVDNPNKEAEEPESKTSEGVSIFAFCDQMSDAYYVGTWDGENLQINQTSSIIKIHHFFAQHDVGKPDNIERWNYEFRFDDNRVFVPEENFVNRYHNSSLMTAPHKQGAPLPKETEALLNWVFANDAEVIEHFLNWVSCIYQHRIKTGVAWVLQGTEGTGKGTLFHRILSPIFGERYCPIINLTNLEDQYNQFMEDAVLVLLDESDMSNARNSQSLMSKFRTYITEELLPIRAMRQNVAVRRNYANFLISTNKQTAVYMGPEDRRFNIANRQNSRLFLEPEQIEAFTTERKAFATYLASRKASLPQARAIIDTQARRDLIETTSTSNEALAHAILQGNLEFLLDLLPTGDFGQDTGVDQAFAKQAYLSILREALEAARNHTYHRLTRDELQAIFKYCGENIPKSPNKFTYFLKHLGIQTQPCRKDGNVLKCVDVEWSLNHERLMEPAIRKLIS